MTTSTESVRRLDAFKSRSQFVRGTVRELPLTKSIIDAIMPFFPGSSHVIAGFVDSSNQYWKVNYHWDLLVAKIDEFLAKPTVAEKYKAAARAIREALMSNAPDPPRGYRNDEFMGATKDRSATDRILARHAILKQSKKDFERVITKAGVVNAGTKKNPPKREKGWWLAVAPVAIPGTSNHGSGYALDIEGNNAEIERTAYALGASLAYNEASHMHCEWKDRGRLARAVAAAGQ